MAGKIFINYRRGDDPGTTGRLFDRLQDVFDPQQLFLDVDNIAPGLDFVRELNDRVAECDIVLSVIGRSWLDSRNAEGKRRLDDPDDFVRIEIESALKQSKRVIPVLVGEGQLPRPEDLPETLRPLTRRNAVRLTHERFRADTQSLIKALQQALEEIDALKRTQSDVKAEQQGQEQDRLKEQEAARRAEEEERRRHAEAAEKQRTEEERALAAAKGANTIAAFDSFLASYPSNSLAEEAQNCKAALLAAEEARQHAENERRLQEAAAKRQAEVQRAFAAAKRANKVSAIEAFVIAYPESAFVGEAEQHKAVLIAQEEARQRAENERRRQEAEANQRAEERREFTGAKRTGTLLAINSFLAAYPASSFGEEARSLQAALLAREETYRRTSVSDDPAVLRSFLEAYHKGADADLVRARLQQLEPRRSWPLPALAISGAVAALIAGALVIWLENGPGAQRQDVSLQSHPSGPATSLALPAAAPPSQPIPVAAPATNSADNNSADTPGKTSNAAPVPGPDEVAWNLIKGGAHPDQLQQFIDQFPNSTYRSEAEQRIASQSSTVSNPVPASAPDTHELARALQFELQRVGCFIGAVNGEFDDATKAAWRKFVKLTSTNLPDDASSDAINAVRGINKRVCPPVCSHGQHAEGDLCVPNPAPPPPKRAEQAEPAPAPRAAAPGGGGGGRGCYGSYHGAGGGMHQHRLPDGGCGY
jgi:outer membrane protein assembly factor BamD (BamD/ComL family)